MNSGADVVNKFIIVKIATLLACFISSERSYTTLKFAYDIGSRPSGYCKSSGHMVIGGGLMFERL